MTIQRKERLHYNGEDYSMTTEPFDVYLKAHNIKTVSGQSSNLRGYVGKWEIKDDKLFLTAISASVLTNVEVIYAGLNYFFPDQNEVFADWFSGEIKVPCGEILKYGYATLYEQDMFLEFKNGVLVNKRFVDNREQFQREQREKQEKVRSTVPTYLRDKLPEKIKAYGEWTDEFGVKYSADKKKLMICQYDLTHYSIIPGCEVICDRAFCGCDHLTSIAIPDSVTSIEEFAFHGCSLTSVSVPGSVTSIGDDAFGCSRWHKSLKSINVDSSNDMYSSESGVLFDKDKTTLIKYPEGKKGKYSVPNSVLSIIDEAFRDCENLTSVIIPNSVTSIGKLAFHGCSGLKSITISDNVTTIGENTFQRCKSLVSVTIGNRVTDIGDYAFESCRSLASVIIGNNVTNIGRSAFSGCISLTSVTIPNSVTNIGESAFCINPLFDGSSSSLTSVSIGTGVTSIGTGAFFGCNSLQSINVDGGNSVYSSESGVLFDKNKTALIKYPGGKTGNYSVPVSVTNIEIDAFYACRGLTSVTIPDGITNIVLYECSNLTSVILPNSIKDFACYRCSSLKSITIPNGIMSIEKQTFSGCKSLTSVIIPETVTNIGGWAFDSCSSLTSVTIPDNVTSISDFAFSNCSNLTSVIIGNSVTSIGEGAFNGCSSLTSITIPDSVTRIGKYAFFGCNSLTFIYVSWNNPNDVMGIEYIPDNAVFYLPHKSKVAKFYRRIGLKVAEVAPA